MQPIEVDGVKFTERCPAKELPSQINDYIRMYNRYKKGWLPFSGGSEEQPNKIMQVFDILDSAMAENKDNPLKELEHGRRPKI